MTALPMTGDKVEGLKSTVKSDELELLELDVLKLEDENELDPPPQATNETLIRTVQQHAMMSLINNTLVSYWYFKFIFTVHSCEPRYQLQYGHST